MEIAYQRENNRFTQPVSTANEELALVKNESNGVMVANAQTTEIAKELFGLNDMLNPAFGIPDDALERYALIIQKTRPKVTARMIAYIISKMVTNKVEFNISNGVRDVLAAIDILGKCSVKYTDTEDGETLYVHYAGFWRWSDTMKDDPRYKYIGISGFGDESCTVFL